MRDRFGLMLMAGALIATGAAFGQRASAVQAPVAAAATAAVQTTSGNLSFDAASVRPSPAPDMAVMIAGLIGGQAAELGSHGWDASDVQLRVAE